MFVHFANSLEFVDNFTSDRPESKNHHTVLFDLTITLIRVKLLVSPESRQGVFHACCFVVVFFTTLWCVNCCGWVEVGSRP